MMQIDEDFAAFVFRISLVWWNDIIKVELNKIFFMVSFAVSCLEMCLTQKNFIVYTEILF